MIIVQLILYCALFTLMVKLGVGNSALNGLFFYPLQSVTPGEDEAGLVDSDLFLGLVDRVVIGDGLTFFLRDGTKWTV